jgi:hypothetical protein
MNSRTSSLVAILAALIATSYGLDSLTVGGVTYENVQLKKEYPSSLFIQHSGGTAFVEKSKLSEEQVASILAGEAPSTSSTETPAPDGSLVSGDWIYKLDNGEISWQGRPGDVVIVGHKNPSGDLVFPSEIDGRPVTGLDRPMFSENGVNITSIKIPNSVTWIMCATFGSLPALTNVSIGKGLVRISGGGPQFGGDKLKNFEVSPENQNFSAQDGVLFNKEKTELIRFPYAKEGKYTVPNGVKRIQEWAFGGCKLTEIIIPEEVTEIEGSAFRGDFGAVKSLIIAGSTIRIGDKAFFPLNFGNLERLSVPPALQDEAERERVGLNFENFADLVSTGP